MPARTARITAAIALGVAAALTAATAANATTIHTPTTDDTHNIDTWGTGGTPTYGQTLSAPETDTELDQFSFRIQTVAGSGDVIFRAEVGVWDDDAQTMVGDPLWVSAPTTVPSGSPATTYHFTPQVVLQPNQQYVLFGTVLADEQAAGSNTEAVWITEDNGDALDGLMVWSNSHGSTDVLNGTWDGHFWPNDLAMDLVWHSAPSVTAASSASGSAAGGQKVVLTGSDLSNATDVTFGGKAAAFSIDSDTQITATAPAHAEGSAPIVVTSPAGSSTGVDYTYAKPVDTALPAKTLSVSVTKKQFVASNHQTVTARGLKADEKYTVTFNGKTVASGKADSKGVVTRAFWVAKDVAGTKSVKVTGSTAKRVGSTTFVVLAQSKKLGVSFSPSPIVEANRTVTATVTGLGAHEKVTVTFAGKTVSAKGATANAKGVYTVSFSAGWSWGYKTIKATGESATRTGSAKVDVEARHNPQRVF